MKVYLAHPYLKRKSNKKYRIKKALEERGLEVIDPFIGEFKILRKYNIKEYYESPDFRAAVRMWEKDLKQIRSADLLVIWLPFDSIGTSAELMYGLEFQKRLRHRDTERKFLIQIISDKKHPLFAYALKHGNQQFASVKDFEQMKIMRW